MLISILCRVEVAREALHHRASVLVELGLSGLDALHIACAKMHQASAFLTCDDGIIKRADRISNECEGLEIANIFDWVSRHGGLET